MSNSKKLGLTRMKLTVTSCRARAKELRLKLEQGHFQGEVAKVAARYMYWYTSKANQLAKKKVKAKKQTAPVTKVPQDQGSKGGVNDPDGYGRPHPDQVTAIREKAQQSETVKIQQELGLPEKKEA
jgi:hypothetical protein